MTSNVTDMSTPITRGELRDELAQLENRIDHKLDHLERTFDHKLDHLERKFDHKLDMWGGALRAQIAESETRVVSELARHTRAQITESETRVVSELARQTQAVFESMSQLISMVDEKYNDLPGRMARLEVDVHALKQR